MAKVRITAIPKMMQMGGNSQLPYVNYMPQASVTPQEREQWNSIAGQMKQEPGTYVRNWDHNQDYQNEYIKSHGMDPQRVSAIQADMLQRNSSMPGSVTYGKQGMSGADNFLGSQTKDQRYTKYQYLHYDPKGNLYPGTAGFSDRGTEPMNQNEVNQWQNAAYQRKPNEWITNDKNIPMNAPQADIDKLYPQQNTGAPTASAFPTRDQSIANWKARGKTSVGQDDGVAPDYSIDAVRSGQETAKFGGMKKRVRITGMPMTGIGTRGPAATPNATMMAMGGSTYVPGGPGGYGNQQQGHGYALDRFWSSPAGYPGATSQVNPYGKIGSTLPEAKDGGDINAEKQERVLGDFDQDGSLELMNVNGPSHAEGGKDIDVPSNSFVFSDTKDLKIKDPAVLAQFGITTMKRGGFTPAEIAKKYDLTKYKKVTDDPNADDDAMKTAQLMSDSYLAKLSKLAQVQEGMKKQMGMEHHDPNAGQQPAMARRGGMYQDGGLSPQYPNGQQPMSLGAPMSTSGNMFMGYPREEAQALIKKYGAGHDNIPYTDEVAAGIGYSPELADKYGHHWTGVQNWEREVYPGYKVSPGAGGPEGKGGIRTLSPDLPFTGTIDPWGNPHDTPEMPAMPVNTFPAGPTGTPADNPAPNTPQPPYKQSTTTDDKGKGKRFNFAVDPNFYGNMQNALQIAGLKKFVPYEPVPQAVIPDTVFLDPTRAIAAQQEEARSGAEMDATAGNPQAARAMALARQGVAGKQAADVIGQYHNQNVQIANSANQNAAQITNQLMKEQANRLAELNKANFLSDRDYQREMGRLQAENVNRYQKQHDNAVKTAWLNKTSPYFDIDPVTQMPTFKSANAKAKYEQMYSGNGSGSSPEKEDAAAKYAQTLMQKYPGMNMETAAKWARQEYGLMGRESETYKPGAMMPTMRYSGMAMGAGMPNTYGMGMTGTPPMYERMGGHVPHYQIGGSFLPLASGPDMPPASVPSDQGRQMPQGNQQMQMPDRRLSKTDIATATHNPGNMKYASWMGNVGGQPSGIPGQDGGEFASFPDFQTGMQAYKEQLFGDTDGIFKSNYYKPHTTVDQALKTWSNGGYDGSLYPAVKNKTLAQLTAQERDELIRRQIKAESASTYSMLKQQGVLKGGGSVLQKFIR